MCVCVCVCECVFTSRCIPIVYSYSSVHKTVTIY